MRLTVERICEGFAVLEKDDLSHIEVDISALPVGLKEGNVLVFDGSAYKFDASAEAEARKRIIEKQRNIFKKR